MCASVHVLASTPARTHARTHARAHARTHARTHTSRRRRPPAAGRQGLGDVTPAYAAPPGDGGGTDWVDGVSAAVAAAPGANATGAAVVRALL